MAGSVPRRFVGTGGEVLSSPSPSGGKGSSPSSYGVSVSSQVGGSPPSSPPGVGIITSGISWISLCPPVRLTGTHLAHYN